MLQEIISWIQQAIHMILHLDVTLRDMMNTLGATGMYGLLFTVIFCETGLVIMPFLPGDSLLFAVGAMCAIAGAPIDLATVMLVMTVAAILGDATNYYIGRTVGPRVFSRADHWLLNKRHLVYTQNFYERHGGKTIIIARFIPIVRTFAPFVAGIGHMAYRRFAMFNVVGAVFWVLPLTVAGFMFGNQPIVQKNFHVVIFGIIFISILPAAIEIIRHRRRGSIEQNAQG
jgi:membrane-associated protein